MKYEALTGAITAPVTGSSGLPACTASVPKPFTGDAALGGVSIGRSVIDGDIATRTLSRRR